MWLKLIVSHRFTRNVSISREWLLGTCVPYIMISSELSVLVSACRDFPLPSP